MLIENALHYSPAGSEVTVAGEDGRIEVRDRGPGLAPGEDELVFERFHRGRAGQQGPAGSGLGLAIARTLARAWHGDARLAESPGRRRDRGARVSGGRPMSAPRRTVLVVVLAVLGIALAAAITWGTSQLVRQRIGLASEPLTAGRRLLPPVASSPAHVAPSSARPAPRDEHAEDPNAIVAPANDGHTDPAGDLAAPSEQPSTVDDADRSARGISTGRARLWI